MSTAETPRKLKIAVIGGGIGGLCLAIGLLKHSQHDVQVYEAAHKFSEIGAGVAFGPNAQRALKLISKDTEEAFLSQATGHGESVNKHSWVRFRYGEGAHEGEFICEPKYEVTKATVHRAKFLEELVKHVPPEIAHFGKRLVDVEEKGEDGIVLKFKDETTVTVDCVIGADGVHSVVRKHLLGADHPALNPVFSGSVAYRGLVPMEEARSHIGSDLADASTIHTGSGAIIMHYPIDFGKTLNIIAIDSEVKSWDGPWVIPADYPKIANRYSTWGPDSKKVIELLNRPETMTWSMWEAPAAPTYYQGRVAMMGDAAHATTPFQGQGAGQAIEDALVLCKLFAKITSLNEIPLAFAAYDRIRRKRAVEVTRTSHEAGEIYSLRFPGIGDDKEKMKENIGWRMDWIWHRDLQIEVDQALLVLEDLKDGSLEL